MIVDSYIHPGTEKCCLLLDRSIRNEHGDLLESNLIIHHKIGRHEGSANNAVGTTWEGMHLISTLGISGSGGFQWFVNTTAQIQPQSDHSPTNLSLGDVRAQWSESSPKA